MRKALLTLGFGILTTIMPVTLSVSNEETIRVEATAKNRVVELRNYGIKSGQDITDDLNAALAAIKSFNTMETTTLEIPAGTYYITGQVSVLPSNLYIKAEKGTIIKRTGGSGAMLVTTKQRSNSNITVDGGTWDGNGLVEGAVFSFQNVTGLKLKNCTVKGGKQNGIRLSSSSATLSNIKAQGNKTNGIYVTDASKATITGVTVSNNSENGITITGKNSKGTITKTIAKANKANGIVFKSSATGSAKQVTVTENKNHGIAIVGATVDMTCTSKTKNVVTRNSLNGVSVTHKDSNVKIAYGNYDNNGLNPKQTTDGKIGHGIGVTNATVSISNVTANNNKECGISPFDVGTKVSINKTTINNNGRHGIGGRKGIQLTVTNSTIKNNGYHGIMLNDKSTGKKISNTIIEGNKKNGVNIGESSSAILENNTISKNSIGTYLHTKSKVTVTGGSTSNNKDCGIVSNKNSTVTVSKVEVSGNKNYGVNIQGGTASITSCEIKKNKNAGIWVKSKANVSKINSNKLDKNGSYGIYVNNSTVKQLSSNQIVGHTKHGIALYNNSNAPKIQKNKLSNTNAKYEIYVQKSKANVSSMKPIKTTKKVLS